LPKAPKLGGLSADEEAALDRAVSPCEDFFAFACGGWSKATKIPDDEASWSKAFSVIREKNESALRAILEEASKDAKATGARKKLGDFYGSCMDEAAVNKAGAIPLGADLRAVDSVRTPEQLAKLIGKWHARGLSPLFAVGSQQDFADSTKMIGAFEQAGLGMPDRDYYLSQDGKFPELRAKYEAHVAEILKLAAIRDEGAAAKIVAFETELAKANMSKEDRRDPKKIYHPTAKGDLGKVAPEFSWKDYSAELPLQNATMFNVAQPAYMAAMGKLAADKAQLPVIRLYLKAYLARASAPFLSQAFQDENFRWQSALRGAKALPPRWKRCVRRSDEALGEVLAQPFVEQTLGAQGKEKVLALITSIESEMKANLETLAWMDPATRAQAQRKLGKIANKIAYPDKWRSYDALRMDRRSFFDNMARAGAFEQARQLAKIGKPVDRNEWLMTPPSVNAYYEASMNEMVFPAGILQPPFYANSAPAPVNFGGIGMVMGHELTHGFDDEGRQFDADGNLKDWWSESVGKEFEHRADCVKKQYGEYSAAGSKVNGELTLGENIADLGGVRLSLKALKTKLGKEPITSQEGDATPSQRFFLGYAHGWCGNYREEAMRHLVATNPHSPPQFRVNGPLSNLPEFAEAFQCKEGHPMVRKNRCEIW